MTTQMHYKLALGLPESQQDRCYWPTPLRRRGGAAVADGDLQRVDVTACLKLRGLGVGDTDLDGSGLGLPGHSAGAVQTILPGATKEAICVAQDLLANERIGIRAHHNGPRLPTWG